ncbi:MAG: SH3 domain-containing protein, partial [Bacillota bacterium]
TVHSNENGWTKVSANGKTGFVSSTYLSSTKPGSSSPTPPVKEEVVIKKVNVSSKSSLNMRTKPDTKASIIVKLASGVQVTVLSEQNGWARIKVYGQEGYVSAEYLLAVESGSNSKDNPLEHTNSPAPSPVPEKDEPVVEPVENTPPGQSTSTVKFVNVKDGSSLNMRSNPSTSSSILTKLTKGTPITVISEENGWAKGSANGHIGYISTQYLTDKQEGTQDSSKRTINTINTQYGVTLEEFTQMQMKTNPQTDKKYTTYIREDALILNDPSNPTTGKVQGTGWKIRGGASTSDWVVGTVKNGEFLQILSSTKGTDGYIWYQVNFSKSWVNASPEDVKKQLDPSTHVNDPVASLQFLKLSETTNLDQFEVNEKILAGKGILAGHAATFATASEKYGVNDVYLISHALLETGNGTSQLAKGVQIYGKTVYNMYGIGAYDQTAVSSGANFAYNAGWFTPEAAIMGGAQFIAQGYINTGQDTLYKMRWNPEVTIAKGVGSHQYATDIGWATKQVNQIHNLYSLLDSYKLTLEVPSFKY